MITVDIKGGLGNQLFQIFTLISYCKDYNLKFCLENIDCSPSVCGERVIYWNSIFKNLQPYLINKCENYNIWNQEGHHHIPIPIFYKEFDIKLNGYFQSYKYFQHNLKYIIDFLEFNKLKLSIKNNSKLNFNECISIHFRLGDYKTLQDSHPILTIDYYIKSLSELIKITNKTNWNVIYYYEADDKLYIDNNINILKNHFTDLNFISCDLNLQDWEQMLQMSLCNHNIIANSSFSLWAAYLNENKEKKIFYPSLWFGTKLNNLNIKDMFYPHFIEI